MSQEPSDVTVEERPRPATYVLVGPQTPFVWRFALALVIAFAILTAAYVARGLLLPIALALLLSALLEPVVRFLREHGIPESIGAALIMILFLGTFAGLAVLLAGPAAEWVERAPQLFQQLRHELDVVLDALRRVSEATEQVEQMTSNGDRLTVDIGGSWIQEQLLSGGGRFLGGAVVSVFLLYFLLASGNLFLRKVVAVAPRFAEKRVAVEVVREIQQDVSRYLFTIAVINSVLAIIVAGAMYLLGMPNPLLWGVLAGLLNFIPYLGPMVTLTVLTAVALLSFDSLGEALLRPAVFFTLTTLEGQVITPLVLGRRLMLNPVAVFLGLIFWGWLWGVAGALIAVPLTMTIKILCDAIPPLHPLGVFLSR